MDEFEWEAHKPEEIDLPSTSIPPNLLKQLSEFIANALEKDERLMGVTRGYLDDLYNEVGNEEEAATLIISYIQQRHKWDVELLAERQDVDEILFREHSLFDDHMWDKVMNTTAMSDLHHEVYKLSQTYISRAIRESLKRDSKDI